MNLLLDTHILLWWLNDSPDLPTPTRQALTDTTNVCFVSAATIWEIEIKRALGKRRTADRQGADRMILVQDHRAGQIEVAGSVDIVIGVQPRAGLNCDTAGTERTGAFRLQ